MDLIEHVVVSQESVVAEEANHIVNSNICFINVLKEEGFEGDFCKQALMSYYLDYYGALVKKKGFSFFVYQSGWSDELNSLLCEAFEAIQAESHKDFFIKQCLVVDQLDEFELAKFLESDYFGKNPLRSQLDNDDFLCIDEDLVALNAQWLKGLPNLKALPIEQMFEEIERIVAKPVSRA